MRFIKTESGNLVPVEQVTRLCKVKGPENFYTVTRRVSPRRTPTLMTNSLRSCSGR